MSDLDERQAALRALHAEMRACRKCREAGFPTVPGAIFSGDASARIMLIGQAPGKVEAFGTKKPFSGPAGKRLMRWLAEAGWTEEEFRREAYISAVTKCFPGPGRNGRGDRAPSARERELCRPFLERELAIVDPEVVIPVGRLAIVHFLGNSVRLADVVGRSFQVDGRLVVPLPHPSGASAWANSAANQEKIHEAIAILRALRPRFRPDRRASYAGILPPEEKG